MRRAAGTLLLGLALFAAGAAGAADPVPMELIGRLGSRDTLLVIYAIPRPEGGARLTGEYVVLATMQRHYLEGERSPEIGVTTLKESTSPIFFGRPATGTLQGRWRDGTFRGMRYGPGGQEREQFEFSERFPSLAHYSATLQCEARDAGYRASLALVVEDGRLKPGSLSWTSRLAASGQVCVLGGAEIQPKPDPGGLRFGIGAPDQGCEVALRDLGEWVRVSAHGCNAQCGSQAYLEPILVDRRGRCRLLRPEAR